MWILVLTLIGHGGIGGYASGSLKVPTVSSVGGFSEGACRTAGDAWLVQMNKAGMEAYALCVRASTQPPSASASATTSSTAK